MVCRGCGLVIEEKVMDEGPEWRSFTPEEKESRGRVGMPSTLTMHNKGLSTEISRLDVDAHRKALPPEAKLQYYRLRRQQIRSRLQGSAGRNLMQAMDFLARLSERLSAPPSVREQAAAIYRKALKRGVVKGRSIRLVVAASLYAALRISGLPWSLSEAAEACMAEKKDVARCYRLIVRELGINIPRQAALTFISKIAEKTGVSKGTVEAAVEILRRAEERHATLGKDPRGLAAAALYVAARMNGEHATQTEIAEAAGVTEVTVRNRFKTLCRALSIKVSRRP